jgi:hypothetical protein
VRRHRDDVDQPAITPERDERCLRFSGDPETRGVMHVRNLIQAHVRRQLQSADVAADVNASIDANVLERRYPADDARAHRREASPSASDRRAPTKRLNDNEGGEND